MTVQAGKRRGFEVIWPYVVLAIVTALFYLPALIGTDTVNSDNAAVALQAKHFLHGELYWFLWGFAYQGSVYPAYTAIFLAIFGNSPWIIQASALPWVFVSAALACSMLRRSMDDVSATAASLLIIFSPQAVNTFTFFPLRQMTLAILMAAFWVLHSALSSRRWRWRLIGGTVLVGVALYSDYLVLQVLPAVALMIALICLERPADKNAPSIRRKFKFVLIGAVLVAIWFSMEWISLGKIYVATSFGPSHFPFDLQLLWNQALPYAFGYGLHIRELTTMRVVDVPVPFVIHLIQCIAALVLGAGIISGIVLGFDRQIPGPTRRLGLVGGLAGVACVASFLVSVAPVDVWSARYLMPILLMAPLALAPLRTRMRRSLFLAGLSLFLCCAASAGWISMRRGDAWFLGKPDAAHIADQNQLGEVLRQHDVHYALADYWLAYRLTFFFNENPTIVPFIVKEDRYAPYRNAFMNSTRSAMIFNPDFPTPHSAGYEQFLKDEHYHYERLNVGNYLVFIVDGPRKPSAQ